MPAQDLFAILFFGVCAYGFIVFAVAVSKSVWPDRPYRPNKPPNRAWAEIRYRALKKTPFCQACGVRGPLVVLHGDHIKPKSKYPALALDGGNIQVLCASCNIGKGAWDETDWRGTWK